ncbi:hypothetical protein ABZ319_13775 [Nocardia sp. NPDC005978]|uniref:hypothetical protein n=1 Tax=Nocardia sp. NPDC005978 TaxID=3156725 RepID=UPI00339F794B
MSAGTRIPTMCRGKGISFIAELPAPPGSPAPQQLPHTGDGCEKYTGSFDSGSS